jgi:hypothetical protein
MTHDEIIQIARDAGFNPVSYMGGNLQMFKHFAELVAAREREACAKVCDERAKGWKDVKLTRNDTYSAMQAAAKNEARALAEALRSRCNT